MEFLNHSAKVLENFSVSNYGLRSCVWIYLSTPCLPQPEQREWGGDRWRRQRNSQQTLRKKKNVALGFLSLNDTLFSQGKPPYLEILCRRHYQSEKLSSCSTSSHKKYMLKNL
jgi:hypothetical protein